MEVLEQGKKVIVSLSPEVLFFHKFSQKSSRFLKFYGTWLGLVYKSVVCIDTGLL